MNCDGWNNVCYDQKEAWNLSLTLKYTGTGTAPDYTAGTYTAYGAKKRSAFETAYTVEDEDYLFRIENTAITNASDLANDILRIPLSTAELDYEGDIYIVLVMNLSANFVVKLKFLLKNTLKGVN